jgi:hypothetical protein
MDDGWPRIYEEQKFKRPAFALSITDSGGPTAHLGVSWMSKTMACRIS